MLQGEFYPDTVSGGTGDLHRPRWLAPGEFCIVLWGKVLTSAGEENSLAPMQDTYRVSHMIINSSSMQLKPLGDDNPSKIG